MDTTHETLIGIATVSQRLVNTLNRCVGHKTVESFRLDKIVVGSRTVLEALNRTSLLKDGNVDDRLVDWLKSEEPQACLRTLNQMEEILNRKLEYDVKSFFKASFAPRIQDKTNEAIRLFQIRKSYFHFLLTADTWNRESGVQEHPRLQLNELHINQAIQTGRCFAPAALCEGGNPSAGGDVPARKMSTTERKQDVNLEKLDDILEWLNAYNSRGTHQRTILLRQPDTCTWLHNTHQYKMWRSTDNSFLWLHGKPGAGKSVLAASVIEALKGTLQGGEVLVFFYCDFRNERSTSAAEVMRSLLSQLLQQFRRCAVYPGGFIDELIEERDGGAPTIDHAMFLSPHVSRAARQFSQQPFLVIDALDECKDVELLLDALIELQKGGIRIFVTSRPLQVIREVFSGLPSISMDVMQHAVSADIKLHARRELDSHRRLRILDSSLKNEIYFTLCDKADGMFRWVQCQLDTLKRCVTAVRIREALNNLPSDLNATYERILHQINGDEEGKIARRSLDWLLYALVPLQLCQIMEILSINLGQGVFDRDSGPVHGAALLDALGSLVMYDEMTDIVILSHFSVKEYLIGESTRTKHPAYHIYQQDAHTQLALLCMCYISAYLKQSEQLGDYRELPCGTYGPRICHDASDAAVSNPVGGHNPSALSFDPHPLLGYVLCHGFLHLARVNWRITALLRAIETLQYVAQCYSSEWERLCRSSDPILPWPTLKHDFTLYILIAFAPEMLLSSFIGRAKLQLKDGTNPLIYAGHFCKVEHARILLSRGGSLNRVGWDVAGFGQCLPLQVALQFGDRAVVDLFLAEGSPVPPDLFMGALEQRAVCPFPASNVVRLVQTDEFTEWVADARDDELLLRALEPMRYYQGSLTSYPSQQDIDAIQRRLIQVGCDPSVRFDETSLRNAVRMGHVATVKQILPLNISFPPSILLDASINPNWAMIRFLLSIGCNVDVASPMGDTPLHLVCDNPSTLEDDCLKSVQALIHAGCNPSACNHAGDTPLHLAARRGCTSLIEYFLMPPVLLPPDILLVAFESRIAPTIRLLVDKGADVHIIAANGDTPLHVALDTPFGDTEEEYLECAEILINAGCNPCLPNSHGKTPIDIAAKNGHLHVVEHLLSMNLLWSPNILLSVAGSTSPNAILMIKFLVRKGANVHVTRPNGDTLLHLAIKHLGDPYCLKRVQILLSAGCNARACNLAGKMPFHIAAVRGCIEVMEYLLSLGISIPSDVMLTQLEGSIWHSTTPYLTTCFLLNEGGDIHAIAENGDTLLHLAATFSPEHDALELIKSLVHAGCAPCVLNSVQETPLHIAARNAHISIIEYLLSLDPALPHDILLAASTGLEHCKRAQTIRYLIDKRASIFSVTTDGNNALHLLLAQGIEDVESVEILIDAGCDPRSHNSVGDTPLHVAARSGLTTVLGYLLSRNVPLPHDILLTSASPTLHFLLERGVELPGAANGGMGLACRTLRSLHLGGDCEAFVGFLIDSGWDLSGSSADETPIHIAARRGDIVTVKYLCSQNVPLPTDVLLVVPYDDSECTYDALLLVRFLIHEGASVNIADSNGDTPLHLALRRRSIQVFDEDDRFEHMHSWKVVEMLLDSGSDPSACNVDGQTPFDIAEANGHFFKENFLRLVRKIHPSGNM